MRRNSQQSDIHRAFVRHARRHPLTGAEPVWIGAQPPWTGLRNVPGDVHEVIVAGACPLWGDLRRSAIVAVRQPSRGAGFADVAQLVAHHLAKVRVAGSNPVVRSEGLAQCHAGGPTPVEWPRGEATACKAVYTGSNPVSTSQHQEVPAGDWRSLASALP